VKLIGWPENNRTFFVVFSSEFPEGLDSQLDPVGSTRRGAQTGILRFTIEIFVYQWLLLVVEEIILVIISILNVFH